MEDIKKNLEVQKIKKNDEFKYLRINTAVENFEIIMTNAAVEKLKTLLEKTNIARDTSICLVGYANDFIRQPLRISVNRGLFLSWVVTDL